MWTYLRILGGASFITSLFIRPLRWSHGSSAFQMAAGNHDLESILVFVGSLAFGAVATLSTFFSRRVVEWLEMLLTLLAVGGVVFFVWHISGADRDGIRLTWAGLMLIASLVMIALGAHGRYRNAGRE